MPELPDVTVYCEALERYCGGRVLEHVRIGSPFLLRSVKPPLSAIEGRTVKGVRRVGKRVAFDFGDELFAVVHLMIAGRFHWKPKGVKVGGKVILAGFDFPNGTLLLTEASAKKRASLHIVKGDEWLRDLDPGGLEPLSADFDAFRAALVRTNHTLKRSLTDPTILSGIGNSYSDEILHHARLSPFLQTQRLGLAEFQRLFDSVKHVLTEWTARLRAEVADGFPEKVTAFRPGMAVHGRFGEPCPDCGTKVQRIAYAENEANYCPECQTGGRLLADRALSRLLREDWPRTLEGLERRRTAQAAD